MEERGRSRAKKKFLHRNQWAAGAGVLALLAAALGCGYVYAGQKYHEVFFPNTTINGVDASGRTVEEVKGLIASGIDGYTLTLTERGGRTEQITKEDLGLYSEFDGSLEELLASQDTNQWLMHYRTSSEYTIPTMVRYDEEALEDRIGSLACLDESQVTKPQDARVSEYTPGTGYTVIPAVQGDEVVREKLSEAVRDAAQNLRGELSLEEAGVYTSPAVLEDDMALISLAADLNRYINTQVTYTFGSQKETLGPDQIAGWLQAGDGGQVKLDTEGVKSFVAGLASKYDTYHNAKRLKTSYGPTVRITGGVYGWRINQSAEAEELVKILEAGESQTREPVYIQKAASHGENDYGDTYVEINLTAQHLFYYKDGKLLVESDFVSGNSAKGHDTPAGTYSLTYKERNATLKGEDYRTPVDYWMPFNGGIGLHDAKWRSTFGGTIYKTSGSHGCVNLPHVVAKTIFENISSGTPVLCYHLEGTEASKNSTAQNPKEPQAESTKPAVQESSAAALDSLPSGENPVPANPGTDPSNGQNVETGSGSGSSGGTPSGSGSGSGGGTPSGSGSGSGGGTPSGSGSGSGGGTQSGSGSGSGGGTPSGSGSGSGGGAPAGPGTSPGGGPSGSGSATSPPQDEPATEAAPPAAGPGGGADGPGGNGSGGNGPGGNGPGGNGSGEIGPGV